MPSSLEPVTHWNAFMGFLNLNQHTHGMHTHREAPANHISLTWWRVSILLAVIMSAPC